MARATFINMESLRSNQIRDEYAIASEEHSVPNWGTKAMENKLLSIKKSLEDAETYVIAAKEYIESSRVVMEKLTDLVTMAQVDVRTAEECVVQSERRIRSLKSEINLNLSHNSDYLYQTKKDSVKHVENSSLDNTLDKDSSEQVMNIIQQYVSNSENINKYKIKHDKRIGVTVIVIGSPTVQGSNSEFQNKDIMHGSSKDSLEEIDQTLDCDLDSLNHSSDESCELNIDDFEYYEVEHIGECCIDKDGKFEPNFHIGKKIPSEKYNESETCLSVMNDEHSSNENCDNCRCFHIVEDHSDQHNTNRDHTKYYSEHTGNELPTGNEDFLIPELLSHNVDVSIFNQKKYLSDCAEQFPNEQTCTEEPTLVETSKSENCSSKGFEPSVLGYISESSNKNVKTCLSNITEPNDGLTNNNSSVCDDSLRKEMLIENNEDNPMFIDDVGQDGISSSVIDDLYEKNTQPAYRISEDSTDTSLRKDSSYITLSEASCDTSKNEDTSDESVNEDTSDESVNEDTSDTSVHDNLSEESLLNHSGTSDSDSSSTESSSETEYKSDMSLTDCLSSTDEHSSSYHLNRSSSASDLTSSLLHDFSSVSINCDCSVLSQDDDISYEAFKDGVSSSYLNNPCESLKENSKLKTNVQCTSKLTFEVKESENYEIRNSPEPESRKSQDRELLLTINLESESFNESSSVVDSTETDKNKVKYKTGTENVQKSMCMEINEKNKEMSGEYNLIDLTSPCAPKDIETSVTHEHVNPKDSGSNEV